MTTSFKAVAFATAFAFVAVQLPTAAFAQGVNITQAEALYNQGKELVEQKKYKEACERFSASLKLDETVNTHVALARCFDLDGKTASSWGEYLTASKKGAGTPAGQYAADQAKAIEKRLLKANLQMATVPDDLTIKIDNQPIPKESLNADLPLDPGDHAIEAAAAGKHTLSKHFMLAQNNSPLAVPLVMEDMTPDEIKAQQHTANGGGGGDEVVEEPGNPIKRWIGVGAIAVGAGAIGYGIFALVSAVSNQSTFKQEGSGLKTCGITNPDTGQVETVNQTQPAPCHKTDSNGLTFADRANRFYIQMGVVGGIGLAFAGVGAALVLTSFGSKRIVKHTDAIQVVPLLSPNQAGMSVIGRF